MGFSELWADIKHGINQAKIINTKEAVALSKRS